MANVLLGVFPMRSECRAPHHSERSAMIKAAVVPARSGTVTPSAWARRQDALIHKSRPRSEFAAQSL
jgi:hypothetical protein